MTDRDYSGRDVVDKLGVKSGQAVAVVGIGDSFEPSLAGQILARTGRPAAQEDERIDLAIIAIEPQTDASQMLRTWRARLQSNGAIWLLTPKRGRPGYVDQNALIAAGARARLVDNKVCSISEQTSAMRFVIRREDRR